MRLARVLLVAACVCLSAGVLSAQQASLTSPALPMPGGVPDMIFYNGKIITVDSGFRIQQAFAVKGDQFLAVGGNAEVRKLAGPNTRQVDLKGFTVVPGIADGHNHIYAQTMARRGVDLVRVNSTAEVLDRIRKAVAKAKPGEVVFTTAGYVCPPPSKDDLDQISTTVPIVMPRGALGGGRPIMNAAAMKAPEAPPGLPTGATGDLPGRDGPYDRISLIIPVPTNDEEERIMLKVMQERNALGITSFRDPSIYPSGMRAFYRLWREGKMTLRASLPLRIVSPKDVETVLSRWGMGVGFGDHWLRIDSMSEDPHPRAGHGLLNTDFTQADQDDYVKAMIAVNRYDWRAAPSLGGQCFPQCQGALELSLLAYEAADRDRPIKDKRWIVEQGPQVTPEQMDRMAKLGVILDAPTRPGGFIPAQDDPEADKSAPVGDYIKHHVMVVDGTDIHGFDRDDNPFLAFYWYVTRTTRNGKTVGPEQKIGREDALRIRTINEAYMTFEENVKGSIEPGKLADFVILNQDIMTVPEDKILGTHPLATYVGGREVYSNKEGGY